jgi:hypothetical protein
MRVEDLVVGKKYRHPLFNFDLQYGGDSKDYLFFNRNRDNGTCTSITLDYDEFKQLTEVREPIKKENVSYSFSYPKVDPSDEEGHHIITGLYVCCIREKLSDLFAYRNKVDGEIVVKHIVKSIELTEEEIQKELENE